MGEKLLSLKKFTSCTVFIPLGSGLGFKGILNYIANPGSNTRSQYYVEILVDISYN